MPLCLGLLSTVGWRLRRTGQPLRESIINRYKNREWDEGSCELRKESVRGHNGWTDGWMGERGSTSGPRDVLNRQLCDVCRSSTSQNTPTQASPTTLEYSSSIPPPDPRGYPTSTYAQIYLPFQQKIKQGLSRCYILPHILYSWVCRLRGHSAHVGKLNSKDSYITVVLFPLKLVVTGKCALTQSLLRCAFIKVRL